MTTDEQLEALLERTRFNPPALDDLWRPRPRAAGLLPRRALALLAAVLVVASTGAVLAASGFVPDFLTERGAVDCQPDECGVNYQVVARFEDRVDANLLAVNVVVASEMQGDEVEGLATAFRDRHPDRRVIVYVFDDADPGAHFTFGLLPSSPDEPAAPPTQADGWIATFDFSPGRGAQEEWAKP